VDLNLKGVRLEVCCHRDTGNADAYSGKGVKRSDIRRRFGDGILPPGQAMLIVFILRGERTRGEPSPEPLGLEAHSDQPREPVHDLMGIRRIRFIKKLTHDRRC
jgi:hypothetical protein